MIKFMPVKHLLWQIFHIKCFLGLRALLALSGQSVYWGVFMDLKDRENTVLSAVPMTQQTVNTVYEILAMCHNLSFID